MPNTPPGGPPNVHIPGKYVPGIVTSDPHTSRSHPEPHVDIDFNRGKRFASEGLELEEPAVTNLRGKEPKSHRALPRPFQIMKPSGALYA